MRKPMIIVVGLTTALAVGGGVAFAAQGGDEPRPVVTTSASVVPAGAVTDGRCDDDRHDRDDLDDRYDHDDRYDRDDLDDRYDRDDRDDRDDLSDRADDRDEWDERGERDWDDRDGDDRYEIDDDVCERPAGPGAGKAGR